MLNKDKLILDCLAIVGWPYASPGSNDENGIDCSGMLCRAYKLQGANIYHGSNRIIRAHCRDARPINSSKLLLEPGMAVFKHCFDGAEGAEYKRGGTHYNETLAGNYYHVGLIASVNPLRIVHATQPCAKIDTTLGNWTWRAHLRDVRYSAPTHQAHTAKEAAPPPKDEPSQPIQSAPKWYNATVNTPDRGKMNLRREPTTAVDNRIGAAMHGDEVVVLAMAADGWARVRYNGVDAWCKAAYLTLPQQLIV